MSRYSIWILEYCAVPDFAMGAVIYGRHNEGTVKLPFGYVVIKNDDHAILVDCGYDHERHGARLTQDFGIKNWHSPDVVLAQVGLSAVDIQHVIITHAHFDHMGALDRFPNATFYLQQRELDRWIWAMKLDRKFRWMMGAVDPTDILTAAELARNGRLKLIDGDMDDLLPGIDIRLEADTHTAGSQYVIVRNDGERATADPYICAGDLVYKLENLDGGDAGDPQYVPVGYATDSQTNIIFAMDRICAAAQGDKRRILSVHENRMGTLHPSVVGHLGLEIVEVALAPGQRSIVG